MLNDRGHEKKADGRNNRSRNERDTLHHLFFAQTSWNLREHHAYDSRRKTDEEHRETGDKPDEQDDKRQKGVYGTCCILTAFNLSHDFGAFFGRDLHTATTHICVAANGRNRKNRQASNQTEHVKKPETDTGRRNQRHLCRVREPG